MKNFIILLSLLLVVTGCRTRGPKFDPMVNESFNAAEGDFASAGLTNSLAASMLTPSTDPFRLGPGDVLEIETLGEGKNTVVVPVGPDGKIYYDILPAQSVWGFSLAETRTLLQREMAKFNRAAPELVINLRGAVSKRVWVLGAVQSPGVYSLSTPTTLLEALAASGNAQGPLSNQSPGKDSNGAGDAGGVRGGFGIDDGVADYSRSFVLRNGKRLPIDFDRLLKGGDLSQNIYLEPDDFIFVRPVELANIYLLGAVGSPRMFPYTRDLTVSDVLISAGGTVKYAQGGRVVIVRGGLTEPKIAMVDYHAIVTGKQVNVRLQPGDIVYVPFTPFRRLAQLAEEVLDQFVRTVAVNEATFIVTDQDNPVSISAPYGSGGGTINTGR
jgi:polysaccharide export outer membrane protein